MHPFLKKMLYFGITILILSIVGVVFYPYGIGIDPILDTLSNFGTLFAPLLTVLFFFLLLIFFLYFLIRREFKQVGYCIFPFFLLLVNVGLLMPLHGRFPLKWIREECSEHMVEVYKALQEYAAQNDDCFPVDLWCDVLIKDHKMDPSSVSCRGLNINHIEGECAFAINKNIVEMKLSEVPQNTVILFETNYFGKNPEKRVKPKERDSGKYLYPRKLVREGAWNQIGGIDTVACSYHAGLGCNILFADGHVEFIKKKDIPELRWKP